MPNLLQLSQSYSNEDSINYKYAWLREEVESGFKELGDLAYDDQVEVAKLGNSIMQGGYLKTELIDALAMRVGDENSNVYISKDGINVKDGNIVVRDSRNAAIITSDGLRVMYIFTSSGELEGWQRSGIWDAWGTVAKYPCSLNVHVPDDLIIDTATLSIRSMPSRWEGHSNVPNGFYHTRNIRLYKGESASDGFLYWPGVGSYWVFFGTQGRMDITTPVLGSSWSPSGEGIKIKTGDIKPYLTVGESNNFIVETSDSVSESNARYMGAMQLEIVITGFLRG